MNYKGQVGQIKMSTICEPAIKVLCGLVGAISWTVVYGQCNCLIDIKVELCPSYFLALDLQLFGAAEIGEMPMFAPLMSPASV